MEDRPPDCCFDDWARANARRARSKETVARITTRLLAALDEAGLRGRTVLDVGCGAGDLTLATLAHGATEATGVDLGAGAIEEARALAGTRGLAARARFEVADGSADPLPRADVVVLNRVLCCFPDPGPLLDNTLQVTGAVYAMTAPVDHGVPGAVNRVLVRTANRWYRLRARRFGGYRSFVHDVGSAQTTIEAAGFRTVRRERVGWIWDLRVYARPGSAGDAALASS
jgi:magnesium-protoporphyrin O-methyltransferase